MFRLNIPLELLIQFYLEYKITNVLFNYSFSSLLQSVAWLGIITLKELCSIILSSL